MALIQLILAAIILSAIYRKMLKWGEPVDISRKQILAPIGLGVVSVIISFIFVLIISAICVNVFGFHLSDIDNLSVRAIVTSFVMAGFTEELVNYPRLMLRILSGGLQKPFERA